MNHWTELSIEFANQRNYLDELFKVYPTIPEGIRDINNDIWKGVEIAFNEKNKIDLLKKLFKLDLFPIKDSYVAFLKRDKTALDRNPNTVDRLTGRLFEMGLTEVYKKSSEPKETNRQIGPLFKRWCSKETLGAPFVKMDKFISNNENAVLDATDSEMQKYAKKKFNYTREKGLDFIARFNNKYVMGETKFLTDFGGHQNAQFADALSTITSDTTGVIKIAILDGVLYIKGRNKMSKITVESDLLIMSALVLREFLYQI